MAIGVAVAQLHRNILEEPEADDLRWIYTDALEDAGRDAEAEFIRQSMRLADAWADRKSSRCRRLSCGTCPWCVEWTPTSARWRKSGQQHHCLLSTPTAEVFREHFGYWRGLPHAWAVADVPAFEREATAVFSRHPIRRVVLRCEVGPLLIDAADRNPDHLPRLPRALFSLLEGGRYHSGNWSICSARCYDTPKLARTDLEAACVRYGRLLAGLPALDASR